MTSEESIDLKEVVFINQAAQRDYEAMPPDVKESADDAITQMQNERSLPSKMFRALKGNLSGVDEIRLPYDSDTYRIYVMLCSAAVYILDAGIKKSKTGSEIPRNQTERLIDRRDRAHRHYKDNQSDFEQAAESRRERHRYLVSIGELP